MQSQKPSGFLVIPVAAGKGRFEEPAFGFVDRVVILQRFRPGGFRDVVGQIFRKNVVGRAEDDGVFDRVPKLPHVARPVIVAEDRLSFGRNAADNASRFPRALEHKVPGQSWNVVTPLGEGRCPHGKNLQAVVEILPEPAGRDRGFEVAVRRCDQADVDRDRASAADPVDFTLLERTQQLGLDGRSQLSDLVQEQRAAAGQLELSLLTGDGSGERALFVTEELAFQESFRQRGAVDGNERAAGALAVPVQRAGDALFSGAACALDQDRGGSRRRLADEPEQLEHRGAFAHKTVASVEFGIRSGRHHLYTRFTRSGRVGLHTAPPQPRSGSLFRMNQRRDRVTSAVKWIAAFRPSTVTGRPESPIQSEAPNGSANAVKNRVLATPSGTPRLIVLDNLREGVIVPDHYDPTLNPLFRDVLTHYGVVAMPCRVRDPDRKGKVESGVGHAQKTPLKGQRFESLDQAQGYLDRWEVRWADTRIHGTTKRQVAAMFAEEKPSLKPLPIEPFRYYQFGERVVHLDGCVEVEAAYYSVPPGWIGRGVKVQWDTLHVRILDPNTYPLLREHVRQKRGGYRVRAEDNPKKTPLTTVQLLARARRAGTHIGTLCDAIHRRQGEAAVRRILGVLSLAKKYGVSAVEDASAAALELHVYEYRFVRRYLERRPPLALRQVDPLIRELTQYRDLINLKIQEQEHS